MKAIKKILTICSFCTLLTTVNCFAMNMEETRVVDDGTTCYKIYQVKEEEKEEFFNRLPKEISVDGNNYKFEKYEITGGNTSETIDINTTKKIISKSNNKQNILNQLGEKIKYEKDGYVGEYIINPNTLKITTNENGFREDLIEKTINYTNLEKNDLDYIPKQTNQNGVTLDLLKTEWEVETTKYIGEYEVPNTYTAKCYYAGKQRINYPNTYTVVAEYFGTATKINEKPYIYTIEYKKEVKQEQLEEKKSVNILPIIGTSTGTIIFIIFILIRNVTVYNYRDGKWVKVGKTRMKRNNLVSLNRFALLEKTNKYKLELSKSLTSKINGKMITINKKGKTIKTLVKADHNSKYILDITL